MFSMHTVELLSGSRFKNYSLIIASHERTDAQNACILSLSLLCRQRGPVQQAGRDELGGAALVACIMPHTSLRSLLHGQHRSFPQRRAKYEYRTTGCVSGYFAYRCSNLRIVQRCHATKSQCFSSYFFVILF